MAHYIAVAKEIGTIMVFYVLHKSCEPVARSSLPQFCHDKAFFPDSWEQIKKNQEVFWEISASNPLVLLAYEIRFSMRP